MPPLPRLLGLPRRALDRRDGLAALVSRRLRPAPAELARAVACYQFKCDERDFARALLSHRTQLWLFRCNQRSACGDFVVVDVSSPRPSRRPAWVVDLKLGAPLRVGGGGAGVQLLRAADGVREAVDAGVLGDVRYELVTGDAVAVLGLFGVFLA